MATILAIESSCDDTSASICQDGKILSNVIYTQKIHEVFGGVVPELASRKHEKNIIPVVQKALSDAQVSIHDIDAIACTRGPGLVGSLLVGLCFAKGLSLSLDRPLIEVNHIQGHVLSNFIEKSNLTFPFLCFTVSGGHTQLILVRDFFDMNIVGTTIDDAAGEAFDKSAKMLGLDYPGGPIVDRLSLHGDDTKFSFSKPKIDGYNFSFSGLKTSIMYSLKKMEKDNPNFISDNINDLCASIQRTIVEILIDKMDKAVKDFDIHQIAIAGGVSANSLFRKKVLEYGLKNNKDVHIPSFEYCTDNAAMIAIAGYYKFLKKDFSSHDMEPKVKNYAI